MPVSVRTRNKQELLSTVNEAMLGFSSIKVGEWIAAPDSKTRGNCLVFEVSGFDLIEHGSLRTEAFVEMVIKA